MCTFLYEVMLHTSEVVYGFMNSMANGVPLEVYFELWVPQ